MEKKHKDLTDLIHTHLATPEPSNAQTLFSKIKGAKARGYLTKAEFFEIAMWKSPRPKKHYVLNSEEIIQKVTRKVLSSHSEDEKVTLLTSLDGISVAVASAILTILDPVQYGIIDIRVWQLLYLYGEITTKPHGKGFNLNDWKNYLEVLRKYARNLNITVRDVERICFFHHKAIQEGSLYGTVK